MMWPLQVFEFTITYDLSGLSQIFNPFLSSSATFPSFSGRLSTRFCPLLPVVVV